MNIDATCIQEFCMIIQNNLYLRLIQISLVLFIFYLSYDDYFGRILYRNIYCYES